MKPGKSIIIITMVFLCFTACKPYDSDKVNKQLMQGKWLLIDANRTSDSIHIDYSKEITYLIIDGDKCIESMPDLNSELNYMFKINDYTIMLYREDSLITKLNIANLSTDSLTLKGQNGWWRKYKKIEQ